MFYLNLGDEELSIYWIRNLLAVVVFACKTSGKKASAEPDTTKIAFTGDTVAYLKNEILAHPEKYLNLELTIIILGGIACFLPTFRQIYFLYTWRNRLFLPYIPPNI